MFDTASASFSAAVQHPPVPLAISPSTILLNSETGDLRTRIRTLAHALLQAVESTELAALATNPPTAPKQVPEGDRSCGKGVAQASKLQELSRVAEDLYRFRRSRDALLPSAVLGEPAWDMLLDLFVHEVEGRKISVTSLCLASSAPSTTALRYIDLLERHGLLSRSKCATDQRVTFVHLTRTALGKLSDVLAQRW